MGDRAALEGRIKQGLVAVRYRNCEMELISNCSVAGSYRYISVTPKSETVRITNADELYAKIPIGAVKLEGQLERDGALNVDMVLVGRHEADDRAVPGGRPGDAPCRRLARRGDLVHADGLADRHAVDPEEPAALREVRGEHGAPALQDFPDALCQ